MQETFLLEKKQWMALQLAMPKSRRVASVSVVYELVPVMGPDDK